MNGFFSTLNDYFQPVEPNEAQARAIERFVRQIEDYNPEWDVFNIEATTFCGNDISVCIETHFYQNRNDRRCYMFQMGARGGAFLTTKRGSNRYIKPWMCEETRVH